MVMIFIVVDSNYKSEVYEDQINGSTMVSHQTKIIKWRMVDFNKVLQKFL